MREGVRKGYETSVERQRGRKGIKEWRNGVGEWETEWKKEWDEGVNE